MPQHQARSTAEVLRPPVAGEPPLAEFPSQLMQGLRSKPKKSKKSKRSKKAKACEESSSTPHNAGAAHGPASMTTMTVLPPQAQRRSLELEIETRRLQSNGKLTLPPLLVERWADGTEVVQIEPGFDDGPGLLRFRRRAPGEEASPVLSVGNRGQLHINAQLLRQACWEGVTKVVLVADLASEQLLVVDNQFFLDAARQRLDRSTNHQGHAHL